MAFSRNVCPPPRSTGAWDGWQVISYLSVYVRVPDSYMDGLHHFSSVPPRLCVHYLHVVPVDGVAMESWSCGCWGQISHCPLIPTSYVPSSWCLIFSPSLRHILYHNPGNLLSRLLLAFHHYSTCPWGLQCLSECISRLQVYGNIIIRENSLELFHGYTLRQALKTLRRSWEVMRSK